jgi:hypothetical protein
MTLLVTATLLALLVSACGGDSDDGAGGGAGEDPSNTLASPDDAATESGGDADLENPLALGLVVEGQPGTVIDYEIIGYYQGDEQQPIGGETTMDDESIQILLTNFIEQATFDVQVVEGGPVTVKGVRGRMEDPEDPFGGIAVEEELYSSELASGGVEFELP